MKLASSIIKATLTNRYQGTPMGNCGDSDAKH